MKKKYEYGFVIFRNIILFQIIKRLIDITEIVTEHVLLDINISHLSRAN